MPAFFLLMLGLAFGPCSSSELEFTITKLWNGTDINFDPARVTLSTTATGELQIEVSAPFFNTPIPPAELTVGGDQCPQRGHGKLYNYEASSTVCSLRNHRLHS